MSDGPPIVVTGVGARTPIGANAAQTFTSWRAGINRFGVWPHLAVDFSATDADGLPTASAMPGMADASWPEKAEDLLVPTLEEALFSSEIRTRGDLLTAFGRESLFAWLAIPAKSRPGVAAEALAAFRGDAETHCVVDLPATQLVFTEAGHAAGLVAVGEAMACLEQREADVAVIGGVDSLLSTDCLLDLLRRKLLLVSGRPSGLIPGEGAAFVVLEREEDARRRGAKPLARVLASAHAMEPVWWGGKEAIGATGLSTVLDSLLAVVDPESDRPADVFVDLNGERGRFAEWALAAGRCLESRAHGYRMHHPADCTGDLGAALGVTDLVLGAQLLARGKAAGNRVLVCGMSESGERAGALLGPVEGGA